MHMPRRIFIIKYCRASGRATVAKEFAIYFKIKVSKSMTNSVRYVFAHCSSRPAASPCLVAFPPIPETYDGAPLIYLHTKAQQTRTAQKQRNSLGLIPPFFLFSLFSHFLFLFFALRPFLTPTEERRLSWLQLVAKCRGRGVAKRVSRGFGATVG